VRDPVGVTGWPKENGRDGKRTPMPWSAAANAGFSSTGVKTWSPIASNAATVNVAAQEGQPDTRLAW